MIIGNGDIARTLVDRDDRLYFASGVSNSKETNENEYEREISLLLSQPWGKKIVYFSSLCIFYSNSRYAKHKRIMEDLVRQYPDYCIVRIGTITWGKNSNLLINNFRNRLNQGLPIEIRDVDRYVLEKDEFLHWIDMIPSFNCEMNITGKRMKVKDIVKEYV